MKFNKFKRIYEFFDFLYFSSLCSTQVFRVFSGKEDR